MNVKQKGFVIFDKPIGVFEVGFSLADGLDLGPPQGHARLEFLQQKIVMAGGSILRGIPFAGSDRVPRPHRFLRSGAVRLYDNVAGLASHTGTTSNFHRSIGKPDVHVAMGLC
jgi:hypothetical protein